MLAAVKAVEPADVALVRALFALRSLPARIGGGDGLAPARDRPLLDQFVERGFTVLADDPTRELVVGTINQAWKLGGGEFVTVADMDEFLSFRRPGFIKAALDFRCAELPQGTRLQTETRVTATDPGSRRHFRRYWLVVRPGSGLVRRSWLQAAKRRAESRPQMETGFRSRA